MDPKRYLAEQRKEVDEAVRNIRDFRVFDFSYVPEAPVQRPEMDQIVRAVLKYERSGIPTNIFAFGSRGCGKTLTVKHLQRVLNDGPDGVRLLYVNARENNTSFKMLAQLLSARARGVSISELFERFRCAFPTPTVVVLDEVDFISEKDPGKEILYLMSRCPENYMLILLANNPKFVKEIDERTRSSLSPVPLHFRDYDAVQIYEILRQRAKEGLQRCSGALLKEIAALVVKDTNADVRIALKTLYYVATERNTHLQESFRAARRDLAGDVISDLNYRNLLVLKAIAQSRTRLAKDIYDRYAALCTHKNEKPFCYTHFYNNLSYLQSLGLILLASAKVGRTYTNRLELLFDTALLHNAYQARFDA